VELLFQVSKLASCCLCNHLSESYAVIAIMEEQFTYLIKMTQVKNHKTQNDENRAKVTQNKSKLQNAQHIDMAQR